jgi:hypothetical protein
MEAVVIGRLLNAIAVALPVFPKPPPAARARNVRVSLRSSLISLMRAVFSCAGALMKGGQHINRQNELNTPTNIIKQSQFYRQ